MVEWSSLRSTISRNRVFQYSNAHPTRCRTSHAKRFPTRERSRGASLSITLGDMRIRAVIFDIYNTLLEKGPPPADAEQQWEVLWRSKFGNAPRISLADFAKECGRIVTREHDAARAVGVKYPEVY